MIWCFPVETRIPAFEQEAEQPKAGDKVVVAVEATVGWVTSGEVALTNVIPLRLIEVKK